MDSNHQHKDFQSFTLPIELPEQTLIQKTIYNIYIYMLILFLINYIIPSPKKGIEPLSYRLTAGCITIMLSRLLIEFCKSES